MTTRTYQESAREIPIARDVDVLVVGGGPAGLAAAIAAARAGAKTCLVEQFGYLGGTATASLMACINGFRNQVEPDGAQVVRGIAEEIVLELKALGGLGKSPYQQKPYPTEPGALEYSYAIDTEMFKFVTMRLCVAAGVDLMLHTYFCDAIVSRGEGILPSRPEGVSPSVSSSSSSVSSGEAEARETEETEKDRDRDGCGTRGRDALATATVRGAIVENKSGRQALLARVVIDASGDADVFARAGAAFWQTAKDEAPRLNDGLMYRLQFGAKRPAGIFACDFGSQAVVWGPAVRQPINGADADQLSAAEVDTRLRIYDDLAAKRQKNPELADARIVETPPLLGIRQTRFIKGLYTLTTDDAIEGRRFDDVIAISPCPIISYYGYRRYLTHEGYDIPYRCLVARDLEGLLAAGRCISSRQEPYESHRAMVPMMAIGQAAGVAAALCCKNGCQPRALNVPQLQHALVAQGAELRRAGGKP